MTEVAPPGEETISTEDILLAEQMRARVEIEIKRRMPTQIPSVGHTKSKSKGSLKRSGI